MKQRAFTLIELSIVLVIIGLIIGGVLVGQDLIKASEIRSLISQKESYQTAFHAFRLKYGGLPGDLDNAETFWGSAPTCYTVAGTGTQTCNGNGDKLITLIASGAGRYMERFTIWQHMANAGLIEGTYTGISGPLGSADAVPGVNVPTGKMLGSAFQFYYYGTPWIGNGSWFDGHYGNILFLGTDQTIGSGTTTGGLLTTLEAYQMDSKIDDGKPGTGHMIIYRWNFCSDATASNQNSTAEYEMNYLSTCAVIFKGVW